MQLTTFNRSHLLFDLRNKILRENDSESYCSCDESVVYWQQNVRAQISDIEWSYVSVKKYITESDTFAKPQRCRVGLAD